VLSVVGDADVGDVVVGDNSKAANKIIGRKSDEDRKTRFDGGGYPTVFILAACSDIYIIFFCHRRNLQELDSIIVISFSCVDYNSL